MRNKSVPVLILLSLMLTVTAFSQKEKFASQNILTSSERKSGWKLLFDGKTFNGWRGLGRDHVPAGYWIVENGQIRKVKSSEVEQLPGGAASETGDLMTTGTYDNFELSFEWKIDKAGNSGLKYNVSEEICEQNGSKYSALGFEYQLLDDSDPMYKDLKPSQFSGSLYDLIPAKNIILKPTGEFNISRIIVNGNHAEHWLNGVKVVEYWFDSEELTEAYRKSKFSKIAGFCDKRKGHIVLQNHSDEAWFRNIKIREL